jgi:hypothetical protein
MFDINLNDNKYQKDERLDYVLSVLDLKSIEDVFINNKLTFNDFILLSKNDLINMKLSFVERNRILNFSRAYLYIAKEFNIFEIISFFTNNKCFVINNVDKNNAEIENILSTADFNKNNDILFEDDIDFKNNILMKNISLNNELTSKDHEKMNNTTIKSNQNVNMKKEKLNLTVINKNRKSLFSSSGYKNEHIKLRRSIDIYLKNYKEMKDKKNNLEYNIKLLVSTDKKSASYRYSNNS